MYFSATTNLSAHACMTRVFAIIGYFSRCAGTRSGNLFCSRKVATAGDTILFLCACRVSIEATSATATTSGRVLRIKLCQSVLWRVFAILNKNCSQSHYYIKSFQKSIDFFVFIWFPPNGNWFSLIYSFKTCQAIWLHNK